MRREERLRSDGSGSSSLPESKIPKEVLERFQIARIGAAIEEGQKVLARYAVKEAEVIIIDDQGRGRYLVNEPTVSPADDALYRQLMGELFYSITPIVGHSNTMDYITKFVDKFANGWVNGVPEEIRQKLLYYIARDVAGYGLLNVLMNDPNVEEVECSGYKTPVSVVHRDYTEYLRLETNVLLSSESLVGETVQKLAQRAGKSVTVAYPYSDFILPEGHRGAVTYSNEISLPGSTFDIRKFPSDPLTISHLIRSRTISPLMAAYSWLVLEHKGFTLVTGGVSCGKTTILNALLSTLHPAAKIFTVEDTPELRITHQNWVRFMTRSSYTIGARDVGLFDLVKASLRYRPDYLVLGEVRGEEIQSLVQAAAVGHGAITTIHAESPEAALVRMTSPPLSVGESFIMLIWNFLQMGRVTVRGGKQARRVLSVTELVPDPKARSFQLEPIFKWEPTTDTFYPDGAAEVTGRSGRLRTIMTMRGWTQRSMEEELKMRAELLQDLVEENVCRYGDVAARLSGFYQSGRAD